MEDLEFIVKFIGSIALSIIIVAIPVLATLLFVVFKIEVLAIFFTLLTIVEVIILTGTFIGEVD